MGPQGPLLIARNRPEANYFLRRVGKAGGSKVNFPGTVLSKGSPGTLREASPPVATLASSYGVHLAHCQPINYTMSLGSP